MIVMTSLKDYLAGIPPFKGLPASELARIQGLAKEHKHSKGETIFNEGDGADTIWLLKEGRIQIFKYTSDGKPLAIESIQPGELFGTLCRMGGMRTYPCTAIAAEECSTVAILDKTFFQLMQNHTSVLQGVCALCSSRLTDLSGLSCMSQEPAEKKVAKVLLKLQTQHGNTIPFTKREVAEMASMATETAFRVIKSLRDEDILESERGSILIKDLGSLKEIAEA